MRHTVRGCAAAAEPQMIHHDTVSMWHSRKTRCFGDALSFLIIATHFPEYVIYNSM